MAVVTGMVLATAPGAWADVQRESAFVDQRQAALQQYSTPNPAPPTPTGPTQGTASGVAPTGAPAGVDDAADLCPPAAAQADGCPEGAAQGLVQSARPIDLGPAGPDGTVAIGPAEAKDLPFTGLDLLLVLLLAVGLLSVGALLRAVTRDRLAGRST